MTEPASRITILRWSLIAAFVLLLGMGTLGFAVAHRRQIDLISSIEQLGASVRTERSRPEWLRDPLLDQLARGSEEIVRVRFSKSGATREEIRRLLELLRELPRLRSLRLRFVTLSDADMEQIAGLTSLEALDLDGASIRNASLKPLARLPRLDYLVLDNTAVGDAGLVHLRAATRLEMISLENTAVTDAGLSHWPPCRDSIAFTSRGLPFPNTGSPNCAKPSRASESFADRRASRRTGLTGDSAWPTVPPEDPPLPWPHSPTLTA